mmetsp:Transcript_3951/g.12528  ORF Transcript_3951/g.12528 Transcript_3951/m.12528 type:complete len:310 (-) Transcript_3951:105-1034(-)
MMPFSFAVSTSGVIAGSPESPPPLASSMTCLYFLLRARSSASSAVYTASSGSAADAACPLARYPLPDALVRWRALPEAVRAEVFVVTRVVVVVVTRPRPPALLLRGGGCKLVLCDVFTAVPEVRRVRCWMLASVGDWNRIGGCRSAPPLDAAEEELCCGPTEEVRAAGSTWRAWCSSVRLTSDLFMESRSLTVCSSRRFVASRMSRSARAWSAVCRAFSTSTRSSAICRRYCSSSSRRRLCRASASRRSRSSSAAVSPPTADASVRVSSSVLTRRCCSSLARAMSSCSSRSRFRNSRRSRCSWSSTSAL